MELESLYVNCLNDLVVFTSISDLVALCFSPITNWLGSGTHCSSPKYSFALYILFISLSKKGT